MVTDNPMEPPSLNRHSSKQSESSLVFSRRTESTREHTFQHTVIPHLDFASVDTISPQGSNDTALAAFAQLGALRLNAARCFVSLVSSSTEYVLAESTRTLSLQYDGTHDKSDGLFLGTSAFPRGEAITQTAMREWRRATAPRPSPPSDMHYYTQGCSDNWLIVSDATLEDQYSKLPFLQAFSATPVRFLCAVPIRSSLGSVLGTYLVVDEKPRYGLSVAEMSFLDDMSRTIAKHFDVVAASARQQRAEKLIQGIGLFNTGKDSLRAWWLTQDNEKSGRARGTRDMTEAGKTSQKARLDRALGPDNSPEDYERRSTRTASVQGASKDTSVKDFADGKNGNRGNGGDKSDGQEESRSPTETTSGEQHSASSQGGLHRANSKTQRTTNDRSKASTFNLEKEVQSSYARASNLLREALDAEGVLFLDASMAYTLDSVTAAMHETSATSGTSAPSTSEMELESTDTAMDKTKISTCKVLGFSTRAKSSLKGFLPSKNHLGLSRSFQRQLMKRYPGGNIFNYAETGESHSSSGEEGSSGEPAQGVPLNASTGKPKSSRSRSAKDGVGLSGIFPGVSSVIFLPIWNASSSRFSATVLLWDTTPLRHFDKAEDVTYLRAFSNSIMAETNRLETMAADQAKSSFISSVSHELRSPLHGVLGGVEFLEESNLDSFQKDMARSIKLAGITLLDTVNNILDYVKIENDGQQQTRHYKAGLERKSSNAILDHGHELMNLSKLTEDVVDTVITAKRFEALATSIEPSSNSTDSDTVPSPVSVSLVMHQLPHWWIRLSPGAWTRILTNLVGNALKYTKQGSVRISISVEDIVETTGDADRRPIVLVVEDTGIGMSSEFLQTGLYTPFQQADSHVNGTGLGLSIVKSLLAGLDGKIWITSEPGRGTRVQVNCLVDFVNNPPSSTGSDDELAGAFAALHQQRICLLTAGEETTDRLSAVRNDFSEVCVAGLNATPSQVPFADSKNLGDFNVVVDTDLIAQQKQDPTYLEHLSRSATSSHRLIVLSSSIYDDSTARTRQIMGKFCTLVSQPLGPRKIARAITRSMEVSSTPLGAQGSEINPARGFYSPQSGRSDGRWSEMSQLPSANDRNTTPPAPSLESNDSYFPGIQVNKSQRTETPETPSTELPDGSPPKSILLVEDNEINMKLLVATVKRLKLPYHCAQNGLIALETYTANPSSFFLMLMDMSMPVMDGFKATTQIRAFEKRGKLQRCRIVALTGVTGDRAKKDAMASGVDEFMAKPISMKQVSRIVEGLRDG
ncbi:hypothetical protein D6C89_09710 [Aureobasidium pullulans]|nr:hypothetical protein D6C89_09710 [Aureobasidium pullulans]